MHAPLHKQEAALDKNLICPLSNFGGWQLLLVQNWQGDNLQKARVSAMVLFGGRLYAGGLSKFNISAWRTSEAGIDAGSFIRFTQCYLYGVLSLFQSHDPGGDNSPKSYHSGCPWTVVALSTGGGHLEMWHSLFSHLVLQVVDGMLVKSQRNEDVRWSQGTCSNGRVGWLPSIAQPWWWSPPPLTWFNKP